MKLKGLSLLYLSALASCMLISTFVYPFLGTTAQQADNNKEEHQPRFAVLACIAWWSHDAVGYHPAMFLMLDNTSGQDITGEEIPFQARFTDLRDGYITVARDYKRTPVHNHERFVLLLRAPKAFELPIDSSLWPRMECKAMCRLPNKSSVNQQVDDLLVTHLAQITMSDEDAHAQLITLAERSPLLAQREPEQEKPVSHVSHEVKNKVPTKLPKRLPKVGDDFYVLEQLYGTAHEFHSGTRGDTDDLTWAHYQAHAPLFDVYAGSRNASKVDVLMVTLSPACVPKEADLLSLAKLLAGCKKEESVIPFAHSVRYLSIGRSETMTTAIRDLRILSFQLQDNADAEKKMPCKIVIFVTRLPGDPETALANYTKRVDFLHVTN